MKNVKTIILSILIISTIVLRIFYYSNIKKTAIDDEINLHPEVINKTLKFV